MHLLDARASAARGPSQTQLLFREPAQSPARGGP